MRHPKLLIAGIGLATVAAAGGVTAAAAGGPSASSPTASHRATAPTVRTASATVAGKTETILVNSGGLPLYFYRPDTAATSLVTRGGGRAVATADLSRAHGHRGKRQAHRGQRRPRPPGRLQRSPAVHLPQRPCRPGDRPGRPELLRGHPRSYPDRKLFGADGYGPGRSGRPRLLNGQAPRPLTPCLRAEPSGRDAVAITPGLCGNHHGRSPPAVPAPRGFQPAAAPPGPRPASSDHSPIVTAA
jgi:hypothetical protein